VEYVGRADTQVKVRGHRIELGEIEVVLAQHEAVTEAAVVACGDGAGGQRLVAYVVGEVEVRGAELRRYLAEQMPEYMVPVEYVRVEELPLTSNGKVDRKALAKWAAERVRQEREEEERGGERRELTATEEVVAGVWAEVLGVEAEALRGVDNFFELGGHSLLATQIASRLRSLFHVEFPVRTLFESPTLASLSEALDRAVKEEQGLSLPPIEPREHEGNPPLSFAQQRLWFLEYFQPGSSTYQIPAAARLSGSLNITALKQSFDELIRHHETLRTSFATVDGQPSQIIAPEALPLPIKVVDIGHLSVAEQETFIASTAIEEAHQPFDLSASPLMRVRLLRLSDTEHVLFFTTHHIISDAWSIGVLIREISTLYEGFHEERAVSLPDLRIQYADYSMWQQQWLQGETLDRQMDYWREQLAGNLPILNLPTTYSRPPVQTFNGSRQVFALSTDLTEELKALSREEVSTLFMTLLAAFQTLLYRYSGQDDLIVGSVIANRNHLESEDLIGYFINALALRTDLSGEPSFRQLLRRVREMTLGAFAHQDLPFEKLVEELQPVRDISRAPLFQVMLVLQNTPHEKLALPGLTLELIDIDPETSKLDLTLMLTETAQGLVGWFEYKTDLFDEASIRRLAGHFQILLQSIIANPDELISELPLLTAEERPRLVFGRSETSAARLLEKDATMLSEKQDALATQNSAVVYGERQVDYDQLNQAANRLATKLIEQGVSIAPPVALASEDNFELLVSILAVLKAGGRYLLLDVNSPATLIRQSLEQSGCAFVISSDKPSASLSDVMTGEFSLPRPLFIQTEQMVAHDNQESKLPAGISQQPIDSSLSQVVVYVLDGKLNPVPLGVAGEVYMRNAGVNRDVVNDSASSAELFPANSSGVEAGARLYKTGLRGCFLPDGNLKLLNLTESQTDAASLEAVEDGAQKSAFVAPRTPTEEAVAAIWQQVLNRPQIGVYDKFFEIGGDSLKIVRVVILLDQLYPKALAVVDLFKYNTIASISDYVDVTFLSHEPEAAIQGFEL
jgi:non-ribosomal peptide synthetase component F/acyl carrier protein